MSALRDFWTNVVGPSSAATDSGDNGASLAPVLQDSADTGGVCTAPPDGTVTVPEVTVVGNPDDADPAGGVCRDPSAVSAQGPPEPNTCEPQDLQSKATDGKPADDSGAAEAAEEVAKSGFWHVVGHKISHTLGGIISIAIETLQLECDSPHPPTKWRFTCSCGAEGENRNSPEEAQLDADSHMRENHPNCDPGQLDGPSCTTDIKDNRCDFSDPGGDSSGAASDASGGN
jgi:hypothetical protein